MGRLKTFLGVVGCALLALGLATMLFSGQAVLAQDDQPEPLKYEGARECQSCHRDVVRGHGDTAHALALQETNRDKDLILGDFAQGEDVRMVQLPEETEARPFTADDVAYAIGAGRYAQAYVVETDRDTFRVLPAQWNVTDGQWEALNLADNWNDPAYDFLLSCAGCHTTGLDLEEPEWVDAGVQCEACHGPAEAHLEAADDAGRRPSDEELQAVRDAINPGIDPQVCGACHSRGAVPEGAPAFSTTYRPGGELSVDGEYAPFGPDDPLHWFPTGHASMTNMQYNEWLYSGHATSLETLPDDAGPECLACHAGENSYVAGLLAAFEAGDRDGLAPEPLTRATAQFGVSCTTCHDPHSDTSLPNHLVAEPYALCTSCHSNEGITDGLHHPVREMFEGAALIEGVDGVPSAHFTAEDAADCLTCHMPEVPAVGGARDSHSMSPIRPGAALNVEALVDTCSECHSEQATPESLQSLIDDTQNGIRARIDAARAAMPRTAPDWALRALDFVEGDGSYGIHNYVYADRILDVLEADLGLAGR